MVTFPVHSVHVLYSAGPCLPLFFFFFLLIFIYVAALGLSCGMWDLSLHHMGSFSVVA